MVEKKVQEKDVQMALHLIDRYTNIDENYVSEILLNTNTNTGKSRNANVGMVSTDNRLFIVYI